MKKCTACQKVVNDQVRFCSQCGGSSFESMDAPVNNGDPTSKTSPATITLPAAEGPIVQPTKTVSIGAKIASVFLSILLVAITFAISMLVVFKVTFSEENTAAIASSFAEDITDVKLGQLLGEDEDVTLDEYIYDQFDTTYQLFVSERDIRKLLKENFVSEFIVEKVEDYTSDLFYNNGRGKLEADEIIGLLEGNNKAIEKATGYALTDADLNNLEVSLEDSIQWDDLKLSTYTTGNIFFSTLRVVYSPAVLVILSIIACLLVLWIFVLCKGKKFAFCCVGIDLLITSILNGIFALATFIIATPLKELLSFLSCAMDKLFVPARSCALLEALAFGGVGLLILIVMKLINIISKKKATKTV